MLTSPLYLLAAALTTAFSTSVLAQRSPCDYELQQAQQSAMTCLPADGTSIDDPAIQNKYAECMCSALVNSPLADKVFSAECSPPNANAAQLATKMKNLCAKRDYATLFVVISGQLADAFVPDNSGPVTRREDIPMPTQPGPPDVSAAPLPSNPLFPPPRTTATFAAATATPTAASAPALSNPPQSGADTTVRVVTGLVGAAVAAAVVLLA